MKCRIVLSIYQNISTFVHVYVHISHVSAEIYLPLQFNCLHYFICIAMKNCEIIKIRFTPHPCYAIQILYLYFLMYAHAHFLDFKNTIVMFQFLNLETS